MRCISCGAEMNVVRVQRDPSPGLLGYEQQVLQCSSCDDVETRTVRSQEQAPPSQDQAAPTAEVVPHLPAPPTSAMAQPEEPLDEGEELLRRAVDMVREPAADGQATRGLTDGLAHTSPGIASEAELDEAEEMLRRAIEMVRGPTRSPKPDAANDAGVVAAVATPAPAKPSPRTPSRVVQIFHDPHFDAAYAAKDTTSGLVVIRHQDSTRLRSMCERLGWRVADGEASSTDA
jgi:hypothetical protein